LIKKVQNVKKTILGFNSQSQKKPNEITRIKTPVRFAVHAHCLVKNQYQYFFKTKFSESIYSQGYLTKFKPLCPVCNGSGMYYAESLVSALSLPYFAVCPVCNGTGICTIDRTASWSGLGVLNFSKAFAYPVHCC
jgi:DnaJ-class molecular chaperone